MTYDVLLRLDALERRIAELESRYAPPSSPPSSYTPSSPLPCGMLDFEAFWKAYPKKVGKKDAYRSWVKAKDKPPLIDILNAIERAKQSEQWTKDHGQFIPNPATWLNQGRWHDEPMKGLPNGYTKIPPFPGPDDPIGRGQWRRAYGDPAHPKILGT